MIVTSRDLNQSPTEFENIILFYPSIKQDMVNSHCEIMWDNNSGAGLGSHPKSDYGSAAGLPDKQGIITQQRLRPKILILWIKISLTTDA